MKTKAGSDLTLDAIEGAGLLPRRRPAARAAAAVILKQCEDYLQTGVPRRCSSGIEGGHAGESRRGPRTLTRSQAIPVRGRPGPQARCTVTRWCARQSRTPGQHGPFRDSSLASARSRGSMGFE